MSRTLPPAALPASALLAARWLVLVLVAGDYLLLYSQRSLLGYLKSPLMTDLNLGADQFGWLSVAYQLPYALAQIGAGYLSDRFPRRTILLCSLVLSAVCLFGMGLVASFTSLLFWRMFLGVAQSASVPAIAGAMADSFSARARSTAVGIYFMVYNLGLVGVATLSGRIADTAQWTISLGWFGGPDIDVAGWRMACFVLATVSLAGGLVLWLAFREPTRTERQAAEGQMSFAAAVRTLLRTPTFLALAVSFVLWSMVILAIQLWLPGYVEQRFLPGQLEQANFQATAWIQGTTVAGLFLGGLLSDRLVQRWMAGRLFVQMAGLVAMAPALVLIAGSQSLGGLVAPMAMYGLGLGMYQANLWPTTFDVVHPAARSTSIGFLNVASGVISTWCQPLIGTYEKSGGALGTALGGLSLPLVLALGVLFYGALWLMPRDYHRPLSRSATHVDR